ncbi:hypothetical protein BDR26DRAFT_940585 [Obelidium mucronatum]|nr:hypothetical protein BDR26DRAFT_940585 [Obelidium mucronatum]
MKRPVTTSAANPTAKRAMTLQKDSVNASEEPKILQTQVAPFSSENIRLLDEVFVVYHVSKLNFPQTSESSLTEAAQVEVLKVMETEERDVPWKSSEVGCIQVSVGKIFLKAMEHLEVEKDGIFLYREVRLPNCSTREEALKHHLAPRIYTPVYGISDFAIGYSSNAISIRSGPDLRWVDKEIIDELELLFLQFMCPAEVKTLVAILRNLCALLHATDLPYLTDPEKVDLFGPDISMFAIVLTHTCCQIMTVSITGFGLEGRVVVHWGDMLKKEHMANAIVAYILWIRNLLVKAAKFADVLKEPQGPGARQPKYSWIPLAEYKAVFPEIDMNTTPEILATFTNPVIRVGNRVYRLYNHILSNSLHSCVDKLVALLRLSAEKAAEKRAEATEKRAEAAEKRAEAAEKLISDFMLAQKHDANLNFEHFTSARKA